MKVKFKKDEFKKWWDEHKDFLEIALIIGAGNIFVGSIGFIAGYMEGAYPHGRVWKEHCERVWNAMPENVEYKAYRTVCPELHHPVFWMASTEDMSTTD